MKMSMNEQKTDQYWMNKAIEAAKAAFERDEVPVGAAVVQGDALLALSGNQTIADCDPTAHAEINALRQAAVRLGNHRLTEASLYVTLEPCAMCIGAMIQARIKRLVFGAFDQRSGAVVSVFNIAEEPSLNHRIAYEGGVLKADCAQLLKDFFRARRR